MPELLEGRTTDPATWMSTPENLARLAAFKREADARSRALADHDREQKSPAAYPGNQQQHNQQAPARPSQGLQP